jgi:hypothetical protein
MARWKLKEGCLFVDAFHLEKSQGKEIKYRADQIIKYPHIMDKRETGKEEDDNDDNTVSYPCTLFNDLDGFIAGFIVMGVDTDLIPQIVASEYEMDELAADKEVKATLQVMRHYDYLVEQEPPSKRHLEAMALKKEEAMAEGKEFDQAFEEDRRYFSGKYDLNFNVNPVGNVRIKYGGNI